MIRAKKKKKPTHRPAKTPFEIVKITNYLNLAVMIRTMVMVYNWDKKQLDEFVESYLVLMQEIADKRVTVTEFVKDTEQMTQIEIKKMLDEVLDGSN